MVDSITRISLRDLGIENLLNFQETTVKMNVATSYGTSKIFLGWKELTGMGIEIEKNTKANFHASYSVSATKVLRSIYNSKL